MPLPCESGVTRCNAGYYNYTYSFAFVDSTGYSHALDSGITSVGCQGVSPAGCTNTYLSDSGYAPDNSGYMFFINPGFQAVLASSVIVTAPSGEVYSWTTNNVTAMADTNGNSGASVNNPAYWYNWSQTLTDDSNISATITGGAYSSSNSTQWTSRAPIQVQYHDTAGNLQTVTVNYSLHSISMSCPIGPNYSATVGMADSVIYPDGNYYQFSYQPSGQLESMRLPTGGTITYGVGSLCGAYSSVGLPASLSRSTPDGSTVYSQTATTTYGAYPATSTTNISKPDGSSEHISFVYVFTYGNSAAGISNYNYETAHTWYSATGTLLKSTMKCYNGATGDCTTTAVTLPITQIATTTILDNGLTSRNVEYLNPAGLVTEVDEYDFGASTPSRKAVTAYAALGNNINNRPSSVTIYGSGGNTVSNTTYGYDEYGLTPNGLTPTSGLQGHNSVSGSRGNQTSRHAWLNTTGSTLDSYWTFDDAGQVLAAEDPGQNWISYGYDSATDSCLISTTPPTPSSGVSQSTSATCDPNTGLISSTTDANSVTTTYSYDNMLRPLGNSASTQAGILAASTSIFYSGSSLPETITTTVIATPDPNETAVETYDGLGRVIKYIAPSGAITDTSYDASGRVYSVSNPYFSASDQTYGITYFTYDALGRKKKQTEQDGVSALQWLYSGNVTTFIDEAGNSWKRTSDAFGRLTNVTEPGGQQTNYGYDVLGNLLGSNQLGVAGDTPRTRSFTYDSLSRLLCSSNPETSFAACPVSATGAYLAGTTGYTYDPNGNLATKTVPQPNAVPGSTLTTVTNYSYDNLNRMLSKAYTNPPSGTLSSCYSFDTATNGVGRLGAEWTTAGSCSTTSGYQTMRQFLAYDPMGRLWNEKQCVIGHCTNGPTPPCAVSGNNAPYYQTYCYDLAGNMTWSVNGVNNVPGVSSIWFTQAFDGAGRPSALTSSWNDAFHPPALFTPDPTAGYTPAGALQNFTLGNRISVINTYDNRLRSTGETATQ
jgi:YD repeat-containing protein